MTRRVEQAFSLSPGFQPVTAECFSRPGRISFVFLFSDISFLMEIHTMRHPIFFSIAVGFLSFFAIAPAGAQWTQTTAQGSLALDDTTLIATTLSVVFLSTDDGASWTTANTTTPFDTVLALAVSGPDLIAGTPSHGVFTSTNQGTSWTLANGGLPPGIGVHAFVQSGLVLFVGLSGNDSGSVFQFSPLSKIWSAASNGLPKNIGVLTLALSGSTLFAGTDGGGVYLSTNNGSSWAAVNNGLTNLHIFTLAVSGANLFAGAEAKGVFRSADNGSSWTAASSGLPATEVQALAVSGPYLFAGTDTGVFLSANNGTTWRDVSTGLTGNPLTVNDLVVSDTELFATGRFSFNVWRRSLAELTFTPQPASDTQAVPLISSGGINDTLSGDSATSRAHRIDFVNHTNASLTITNADLTILNNHFSMSQIFPGLPDTVMPGDTFSMIVNFTGNDSGTVYLDTIVLTIDPDELVSSYYVYLKGNSFGTAPAGGVSQSSPGATADLRIYPNPFSQSTQIAFTSASGYADVSVVNLLGVEVARIFDGELDAGAHSFTWDASGMAPGTYWAMARINGDVDREAIVLAR